DRHSAGAARHRAEPRDARRPCPHGGNTRLGAVVAEVPFWYCNMLRCRPSGHMWMCRATTRTCISALPIPTYLHGPGDSARRGARARASSDPMVNRNLIRSLEGDDIEATFAEMFPSDLDPIQVFESHIESGPDIDVNRIVDGRIIRIEDDLVLVDVGFKSEGTIPLNEWSDDEEPPKVGDIVQVLDEQAEDAFGTAEPYGMGTRSRRKAEKIKTWDKIMESVREGQVVTGTVTRKIKGGLLVDIGVPVFLPASQVDIRRPGDIGD